VAADPRPRKAGFLPGLALAPERRLRAGRTMDNKDRPLLPPPAWYTLEDVASAGIAKSSR